MKRITLAICSAALLFTACSKGGDSNPVETLPAATINSVYQERALTASNFHFTVSFDIRCTDNYTWGSSAVSFFLSDLKDNDQMVKANQGLDNLGSSRANTVLLKMRPAKDNNEGVEFCFRGPKADQKFAELRNNRRKISTFTGEGGMDKATVIIQVRGAAMQISINNEKILDEKNIIPPGVVFSTMCWAALGSSMEEGDTMYLGNIKITKD